MDATSLLAGINSDINCRKNSFIPAAARMTGGSSGGVCISLPMTNVGPPRQEITLS